MEEHTVLSKQRHPSLTVYLLVVFPWLALIALSGWVGDQYRNRHQANSLFPNLLYSRVFLSLFSAMLIVQGPANDAIRYENRLFHSGSHEDTTQYQGYPSPEIDRAWNDLYSCTFIVYDCSNCANCMLTAATTLIPREMAEKLENRTVIYPPDSERRYMIQLDVFHQLHCLVS
jgi:hypothetical protein